MFPQIFPPARLIVCYPLKTPKLCSTCRQPTESSRALSHTVEAIRAIGRRMISQKKSEILASTDAETKGGVRMNEGHSGPRFTLLTRQGEHGYRYPGQRADE